MYVRVARFAPALILICGLLAYAGSLSGAFVFDDVPHITHSDTIDDLGSYVAGSSRPLTALTLYLNHRVNGYDPVGYHVVNVLIHLIAALLLYGIVRRTLARSSSQPSDRWWPVGVALLAALVWVVHPLTTMAVTYVIQRAESLMGCFYLLTLYAVIRSDDAKRRGPWEMLAVVACALGMASKAIMVTCPLMVLLYDRTFSSRSWIQALRHRRGLYSGLMASWVVVALLVLMPNESSATAGFAMKAVSPWRYLATQPGVICHYLALAVWPQHLALDYGWPPATEWSHVLWPALLVCGLVVTASVALWQRRGWGYCLLWFFVVLAPSSSFIPVVDYAFEHRVYLALAGLTTLGAGALAGGVRWSLSRVRRPRALVGAVVVLVVLLVGLLMHRTVQRNRDYASLAGLVERNVETRPYNFRARLMLIGVALDSLRFEDAEREARRMIADLKHGLKIGGRMYDTSASDPGSYMPHAYHSLGRALLFMGREAESLAPLEMALRWDPDLDAVHHDLAVTLARLGRYDEALHEVAVALSEHHDRADTLMLRGLLQVRQGHYIAARNSLEQSVALEPRNTTAQLELAWLLATAPDASVRDGARAVALAEEVCRRTRGMSCRGLDVLASAYAEAGRFDMAISAASRALRQARCEEDGDAEETKHVSTIVSNAAQLDQRLARYRQSKPWRQRPVVTPEASDVP